MMNDLFNKPQNFVGAKYIASGIPRELVHQDIDIQKSLSLFEQLPMVEKLKLFFTTGMMILAEKELCLNVTALHFRLSNLKKLRNLMNSLIEMNQYEIPVVNTSNDTEEGFQMIMKGISKIYGSEHYDGKETTNKLINKLATPKMQSILNEFCSEVYSSLHTSKDLTMDDITKGIEAMPMEELIKGMDEILKKYSN